MWLFKCVLLFRMPATRRNSTSWAKQSVPKWWRWTPNLSASCSHSLVGDAQTGFLLLVIMLHMPFLISVVPFWFAGVHKLEKGTVTLGMVTNILPQVGLMVKLPFGSMGTVAVTDLADAYKPNLLKGYSKNQLLRSVDAAVAFGWNALLPHGCCVLIFGTTIRLQTQCILCKVQISSVFFAPFFCLRCFLLGSENGKWRLSLRPSRYERVSLDF